MPTEQGTLKGSRVSERVALLADVEAPGAEAPESYDPA